MCVDRWCHCDVIGMLCHRLLGQGRNSVRSNRGCAWLSKGRLGGSVEQQEHDVVHIYCHHSLGGRGGRGDTPYEVQWLDWGVKIETILGDGLLFFCIPSHCLSLWNCIRSKPTIYLLTMWVGQVYWEVFNIIICLCHTMLGRWKQNLACSSCGPPKEIISFQLN